MPHPYESHLKNMAPTNEEFFFNDEELDGAPSPTSPQKKAFPKLKDTTSNQSENRQGEPNTQT
jgi:hypothetical protein